MLRNTFLENRNGSNCNIEDIPSGCEDDLDLHSSSPSRKHFPLVVDSGAKRSNVISEREDTISDGIEIHLKGLQKECVLSQIVR